MSIDRLCDFAGGGKLGFVVLQLSDILIESVGVVCFRGKKWRENRASKYTRRRKRSNGDLRGEVGRIRDDLVGGQQDIAGSALS